MAQLIDWTILSNKPSLTINPEDKIYSYDLFNITNSECLVYGHRRGNNINLVWGDPDKGDNILFQRKAGSKGPIKYEEPIAISVRRGGFLVYESGRWGINLGWCKDPRFEWKLLGGKAGNAVPVGKAVGLYSMVEKDSLMYESRDWGINCKWFKDSGKWQTYSGLLNAGKTLRDVYKEVK